MFDYRTTREWRLMAADIYKELNEVYAGGAHLQLTKRKRTLEAIVEAELAGRPKEDVWSLSETCTKNVWYKKWSNDPIMQLAMKRLRTAMMDMQDAEMIMALNLSKRRLALLTPDAVDVLEDSMEVTIEPAVRLRASTAVLDRADYSTAEKTAAKHDVSVHKLLSDEDQAAFREWMKEKAAAKA